MATEFDLRFVGTGNFFTLGRELAVTNVKSKVIAKSSAKQLATAMQALARKKAPERGQTTPAVAKMGLPHILPGNLKRAIYQSPVYTGADLFYASVGVDLERAPYAPYVEHGTGAYAAKGPRTVFGRIPGRPQMGDPDFRARLERGTERIGKGMMVFPETRFPGSKKIWAMPTVMGQRGQLFMRKSFEETRDVVFPLVAREAADELHRKGFTPKT